MGRQERDLRRRGLSWRGGPPRPAPSCSAEPEYMPPTSQLSALLLIASASCFRVGDIEHFLVLFMENRAFDHIFGCAKDLLPGIDAIPPDAGNWKDPNDHSKGFVKVECGAARYVCHRDEDHSFTSTTIKIFGPGKTDGAKAPC